MSDPKEVPRARSAGETATVPTASFAERKMYNLRRLCVCVFLLSLVLRLGYILAAATYQRTGAAEMERAAVSIAVDGKLANVFFNDSGVTAHVAPLYPAMLGALYRILGIENPWRRLARQLLATLASSAAIALLPLVARKAGVARGSGAVAAVLMAVLPLNLWVETSGAWEQPYAALALIGQFLTVLALHRNRWDSWKLTFIFGLVVGTSALLSPALVVAGVLMVAGELWVHRGARRRVLAGASVAALISMLLCAPWVWRNYRCFGTFIPIRGNLGLELMIGNNPQSDGRRVRALHPYTNKQEAARLAELGEVSYMREKRRMALRWIRENPDRFLVLTVRRFYLLWFPPASMWDPPRSAVSFKMAVFTLTSLGAFAGLAVLFVSRDPHRWLFSAALLGPSLIYLVTHVDLRYRYPMTGFALLLGCHALVTLAPHVPRGIRCKVKNSPPA